MAQKAKNVAIIMDGNGRWATLRGRPRWWGHVRGARVVKKIIRYVNDHTDIKTLTLWAYSTDNEKRTNVVQGGINEVQALMYVFRKFIIGNTDELHRENVRVTFIGDLTRLPENVQRVAYNMADVTKDNTGLHLQIALAYGGEDEIERAVKKIVGKVLSGEIEATEVSSDLILSHLDTAGVPDPDLIIRTSGEYRLSGFMPLQQKGAELVFEPCLWPDFTSRHLDEALAEFTLRERRFGGMKRMAE